MQAEADDTVIVGVEWPGGVFAEHRAEGIDERFPEAGPVAARPGGQRDGQPGRARAEDGRLRRLPRERPHLAVIVWSAIADRHAQRRCMSLSARDYMRKPVPMADLLTCISAHAPNPSRSI